MLDFPQHVGELLERLKEKKENLFALAAILILKVEAGKVEMAEKKEEEGRYWVEVLVKLVALKRRSNTQAVLECIKLGLELDTY